MSPLRFAAKVDTACGLFAGAVLVCALVLLSAGCGSKPVPAVVVAPTGDATAKELAALKAQVTEAQGKSASQQELAQIAAGAVYGAGEANSSNPAGLPREATVAQLAEAAHALPLPTDAQKLEKAAQVARSLAGELAAVKAEMGQKATQIDQLQDRLAASQAREVTLAAQVAAAVQAGETERAAAAAKLQKQFDDMSARIKAARDEAANAIAREQVSDLNRAAAICAGLAIAATGLSAVFGGLGALRAVGPFAALLLLAALLCFGLAQIVGLWWFKWAVLGALGVLLALAGWWVVKHYRLGSLQADTTAQVDKLRGVLSQTVPVLDRAYNEATAELKKFMDDHIFSPLNDKMDASDKATVHEIRAQLTKP